MPKFYFPYQSKFTGSVLASGGPVNMGKSQHLLMMHLILSTNKRGTGIFV